MKYEKKYLTTDRLNTAYIHTGKPGGEKLVLVHGNVSDSAFFSALFPLLENDFEIIAPDLRCFGDSEAKVIDGTRGYRDYSDDVHALLKALGWEKFTLAGWSMGGGVVMQYAIDHPEELKGLVLLNPSSPYGFGGTYGEDGKMLEPAGLGTGGACQNPNTVAALVNQDKEAMKASLNASIFAPDFFISDEDREMYAEGMLKTKVGDGMYPGDFIQVGVWPMVAAGTKGVNNTMSATYGNVSGIVDIAEKPPILWVHGARDLIVSDTSYGDFGTLGKAGMLPGWPGEDVYPPQPMVSQTRYVLQKYQEAGGKFTELLQAGAHGCFIEDADEFVKALKEFAGV